MSYFIKTPTIAILLICISGTLLAQQTTKGFSKGKAGKTNFTLVAQREILNPVMQKLQLPPEEAEDEIKIQNPVNINKVAPFTGKLTVIKQPVVNSPQVIEEFPCNNFNAIDDNAVTAPPDVNGAVGFDHLMSTLN